MKNKDTPLILECLKFFVANPYDKIHLREFARKSKISPNSANRFLNSFVNHGFLTDERIANLRYFKANLNSPTFRQLKKTFSVFEIEKSGILNELSEVASVLVVFGSVASGEDFQKSDVDFLVISDKKEETKKIFTKFQKKFNREISFKVFTSLEWKNQKTLNRAFYEDVLANHINLLGELLL